MPTTNQLIEQLTPLLKLSAELAVACVDRIPESIDEDQDEIELFEVARDEIALTMVEQNAAWEALEEIWPKAIAFFSSHPESRMSARHLREYASKIADYHEAGHWLEMMLAVLHDEPIVVIEPGTSLGILGQISGIVDNFQLNVLLMDAFPGANVRRVPQAVADVARGIGPQQSHHTVTGLWNLYTWQAIQTGTVLPDPSYYTSKEYWIWNEGTPADILSFEGRRVILLGPAPYSRSWQSQRIFSRLPAKLEIERTLSKDEVNDWLGKMVAAKTAS
jgi:hypothetical protein